MTVNEPPASRQAPGGAGGLDRRLLASPHASSQSSLTSPSHTATTDAVVPIQPSVLHAAGTRSLLPCPQARLLQSWWQWPSYFTLSWMTPLVLLAVNRPLRFADLWDCYPSEHADDAWAAFEPHWAREQQLYRSKQIPRPRLLRALTGMVGWFFLFATLSYAWVPVDQLLGPQFLNQLVSYSTRAASDPSTPAWDGYKWAVMMTLSSLGTAVSNSLGYHLTQRVFLRVRSVLMLLIYRKTLRLSSKHRSDGGVQNLFTSDTQKILELGQQFQGVWTSPIIIAVAIYELYDQVRWSAFLGLACLLLFFPVAAVLIGMQIIAQEKCAAETDKRIGLINEMVIGVRVLKYLAWERSFLRVVDAQREKEVAHLRSFVYLTSLTFSTLLLVPLVMAIVIFVSYAGRGEDMSPSVVFVTLSLINVIRWPFTMLPMSLGALGQGLVAINRIEEFLMTEEIDTTDRLELDHVGLQMTGAQFAWPKPAKDDKDKKSKDGEEGTVQEEAAKEQKDSMSASTQSAAVEGAVAVTIAQDRLAAGAAASTGLGGGVDGQVPLPDGVRSAGAQSADHVGSSVEENEEGSAAPVVPRLTSIDLSLRAGELLMVLGAVGSGKSTLLYGMLNEVEKTAGTVALRGRVSYVPQSAFIVNASLRDNIVFSEQFDQSRYDAAVAAACLLPDIAVLPNGDLTEIGERGINLSGGQKQRVQLARAAYQQSDIVLLDDPLSAVDSHVARHIFTHCINGLMSDRARVLVTHSLAFVDQADNVALLRETDVKDCYTLVQGTATQLRAMSTEFQALEAAYVHGADKMGGSEAAGTNGPKPLQRAGSVKGVQESSVAATGSDTGGVQAAFMEEEEQETGVVDWAVYRSYIAAGCASLAYFIIPVTFLGAQAVQTASDFWLAQWSNELADPSSGGSLSTGGNLGVYAALIFGTSLVSILRSFCMAQFGLRASRVLHHNLAASVLRKSVSWFDRTPTGRLTNRFTKDIYSIDYMLPVMSEYAISISLQVVGTLIVIAIILPILLAITVPLVVVYLWLTRYYRMANRDLARIESISRTPISAHFTETLQGAVSIRALRVEEMYMMDNVCKTDDSTRALYYSQTVQVWLRVRLDVLGSLILCGCAVFGIAGIGSTLSPGKFGLLLTYALSITNSLNYAVMLASMAESMMNSVERVLYYSVPRDEEAWDAKDPEVEKQADSSDWPQNGAVEFRNVQLRYREELGPVLKGLSVSIRPGERIGIVGRTGSGKSSMLVALFRMVEPCAGQVLIDGVDVSALSLTTLRSRLSIIPQDATLFAGTLRYNCDPFDVYSDDDVWRALGYVQLAEVVRRMPQQLHTSVIEAGSNLSVGQRQLLCLARALLRRARICCLDEASASVDVETDALIQQVIREQFVGCTIITIAHRLNTVLDYSRIVVLQDGQVVECGTPDELRNMPGGVFAEMVRSSSATYDKDASINETVRRQ